jgi:TetR/AcrR family transcriptional regulator, ethionamide resistance regulator
VSTQLIQRGADLAGSRTRLRLMPPLPRAREPGPELTTRGQIIVRLKQALEVALADGTRYADLEVEQLAQDAGISRSSFYVYFEDKVDLIRELADDVIAGVIEIGREWWELPPSATRDDLHGALGQMMRAYRAQAPLVGVLVEAAAYDERVRAEYMSLVRRSRRAIEEHIRDGQQRGFVRAEIDADTTATWLAWMLSRGSHELIKPAGPAQFEKRLTALTDILWRTLYAGVR